MKPINNFETVQATTGEFKRPTPNGYICKITLADDYPFDANEKYTILPVETRKDYQYYKVGDIISMDDLLLVYYE